MRRVVAAVLGCLMGARGMQANAVTLQLSAPRFVDNSVGRLFADGERFGARAELPLRGDWSLSVEGLFLHKDWGTANYALAMTPVMVRHQTPLASKNAPVWPYLSVGAGCTAMTLFGMPQGILSGLGPAFSSGVGLDFAKQYRLELETQFGQVNAVRYLGVALGLGMTFGGTQPPSRMITSVRLERAARPVAPPVRVREKPPLPQGRFMRIGMVASTHGNAFVLSLDELPYRVEPGDTLLVYYLAGLPVKVAKIRITEVDPSGKRAEAETIARTEAVQRGYLVGTL